MHLAPESGEIWRVIEADGFTIDRKIDMLLSGDNSVVVTKSTGLGVIEFADAFAKDRPDLAPVLKLPPSQHGKSNPFGKTTPLASVERAPMSAVGAWIIHPDKTLCE
jgi:hypothetical protein